MLLLFLCVRLRFFDFKYSIICFLFFWAFPSKWKSIVCMIFHICAWCSPWQLPYIWIDGNALIWIFLPHLISVAAQMLFQYEHSNNSIDYQFPYEHLLFYARYYLFVHHCHSTQTLNFFLVSIFENCENFHNVIRDFVKSIQTNVVRQQYNK